MILKKFGRLQNEEWLVIMRMCVLGAKLLLFLAVFFILSWVYFKALKIDS